MTLCNIDRLIESNKSLKGNTGVLLRVIFRYSQMPLGCIMKNEMLAKKINVHTHTIERILNKLTKLGYILRTHLIKKGCHILRRKIEVCMEKLGFNKRVKKAYFSKNTLHSQLPINSTENPANLNTSRPPKIGVDNILTSNIYKKKERKRNNWYPQQALKPKQFSIYQMVNNMNEKFRTFASPERIKQWSDTPITHSPVPTPPTETQKEELRAEFEQVLAAYPNIPEKPHDINASKRAYSTLRLTHNVKIEETLAAIEDLKKTHANHIEIVKKWADTKQSALPPLHLFLDVGNLHIRLAIRGSTAVVTPRVSGLTPKQKRDRRELKKQFERVSAELRQCLLKGDEVGMGKATAQRAYINQQIAKI